MARVGQQIVGLDRDRLPDRVAMGVLTRVFPPGLVDEVVAAAKVGEQRIRILPARLVVYYTLAMIVFFQSSYPQVWVKLIGGLDWAKSFRDRVTVGMPPSPAAISKARARLGWKVMADLLDRVAGPVAGQGDGWAYVADLRLVAVDGLTVDVPDTAKNAAEFGHPGGGSGPGAFPQVRVVALADCGSRALIGARCAGITTGEQALTAQLMGLLGWSRVQAHSGEPFTTVRGKTFTYKAEGNTPTHPPQPRNPSGRPRQVRAQGSDAQSLTSMARWRWSAPAAP